MLVAAGYTYAMVEQARALVSVGRGLTYRNIAISIRRDALCPKGPRKASPTRDWLPRAVQPRIVPTTTSKDYDYHTPRAAGSVGGPYSRSRTMVAQWIDVFAPAIIAAYAPTVMPTVIALDSKPVKRRAWAADEETGEVGQVQAGERNGEVMVLSDRSDPAATARPIIAALEGGKDTESWLRVFDRLPGETVPFWVVADLDSAIDLAVDTAWKGAIRFRCEEHLRRLMHKALVKDGIPMYVTPAEARRLGAVVSKRTLVKAVRRNSTPRVTHPLHTLINRSLKTPDDWEALKVSLSEKVGRPKAFRVPLDRIELREWIADHEDMVEYQFEMKALHPTMPKTAGGVEGTLSHIGDSYGRRSEFFTNARRLELIIGLAMLDSLGEADEVRYSQIIGQMIIARGGAGMDWKAGHDVLGTSSVDALIDRSEAASAVGFVERELEAGRRSRARRTEEQDAERALAGLPPTYTPHRRENGPISYHKIEKGQTVATTPVTNRFWRPDHNQGLRADEVGAGSGKFAFFVCDAHPGHLHIWERRVVDMTTLRTGCPYCAGRQVCDGNSLRGLYPSMAKEWSPKNGLLTPDNVTSGAMKDAIWDCSVCGHEYRQRVSARTRQHQGCPNCVRVRRLERTNARRTVASKKRRVVAAANRLVKTPPVIAREDVRPLDPKEATWTVRQVATFFGRTNMTIGNWINARRMQVLVLGPNSNSPRVCPVSEVRRLADILGVAMPKSGRPPASVQAVATPQAEKDSSITWFAPEDQRISDEPVTY